MLQSYTLSKNNRNKSTFSNIWKERIFIYSLFLLPVGLVFGEVPTSVSEICVFISWLVIVQKKDLIKLMYNKYFLIFILLYTIHIIGLFYTNDFNYAWSDLRIKIPLIFFPVIFFSKQEIIVQYFITFQKWFVITVLINLLYLTFKSYFNQHYISDVRHVSLFISHIRLGLIAAFASVSALYLIFNDITSKLEKIFFFVICSAIVTMMYYLGLISGIGILLITILSGWIYLLIKQHHGKHIKIIFSFITILFSATTIYIIHLHQKYFPKIKKTTIPIQTYNGNKYHHDTLLKFKENGYLVFINICDKELKKEWEKRSPLSFDGQDKKNNELKYTLYRYMSSKALTKDSIGITQLSKNDIQNIESGCPNFKYCNANFFEKRFYELMQEYYYYKYTQNPTGKTIIMRLFYAKIAWKIWMKNFWLGVGTGDVKMSFDKEYQKYPQIPINQQLRAHNQFLTIAVSFGISGLIIFILFLFFPIITLRYSKDYLLLLLFSIIMLISFLFDDTLETQPGVTFVSLFFSILITRNSSY